MSHKPVTMADSELCRLCAESKTKVIGIYDSEGLQLAIEEKIVKFLHLQVSTTIVSQFKQLTMQELNY